MTQHAIRHNRPVNDRLHPAIYKSLAGLALWLVVSVWFLFNRGPYMALTVAVITGFFFIIVMIPFLLWMSWRHQGHADSGTGEPPFREWAHGEFQTWTGPLTGTEAATQILLPIAAVSLGMTVFGLVLYFTLPTLGYS
jgi:hypothetical protein